MRQTSTVVYCAIDTLISPRGKVHPGFQEFTVALDHAGIPAVWISDRTRLQLDDPRRKLGHNHPFIAEGGSGVYLPEGYFHLRPSKTLRLGRFTCVPQAEPQPAASEALQELSGETGVPVVSLGSLSPRELAQNVGSPAREAELARQRDFDELFFFAGTSQADIDRFADEAGQHKQQLRSRGVLWSLAINASLAGCVRELSKLYDRALRSHAIILGVAASAESNELFATCERSILLTQGSSQQALAAPHAHAAKSREIPLNSPDVWERVLEMVTAKN